MQELLSTAHWLYNAVRQSFAVYSLQRPGESKSIYSQIIYPLKFGAPDTSHPFENGAQNSPSLSGFVQLFRVVSTPSLCQNAFSRTGYILGFQRERIRR